jgi:hypothetical protein
METIKEKIVQIIGHGMERERAELMASEIILNFNAYLIEKLKEVEPGGSLTDFATKLFINL